MKLTMKDITEGTVDLDAIRMRDIKEFVEENNLNTVIRTGTSKAIALNDIIDEIEATADHMPLAEKVEEPEPNPMKPVKAGEKCGYYGLGYRANGEHICPTFDGSPDKGSNAANRGPA